MAIFARRDLQRMLDGLRKSLTALQHQRLVDRLNGLSVDGVIGAEWEVVVLYGLSCLGSVEYEVGPDDVRHLDVTFRARGEGSFAFAGDVAAVTDLGVEKDNPRIAFFRDLHRRAAKVGLTTAGIHTQIGRRLTGKPGNQKVLLALPPVNQFYEVFDPGFQTFLLGIRDRPQSPSEYHRQGPEVDVHFKYAPGEALGSAGYPTYGSPVSLIRNPLYNSLVRKAKHIKASNVSGPTVIFCCDGGAYSIRHQLMSSVSSYDRSHIVRHCLTKHSVSAVCLITVEATSSPNSIVPFAGPPALRIEFFGNQNDSTTSEMMSYVIGGLRQYLPRPVDQAINAIHRIEAGQVSFGRSYYGGCTVSESVKLSARAVQDLLAGRLDSAKFVADHQFRGPNSIPNPFERALAEGRTIKSVSVERSEHDDDDWMTFHFSDPDPAISRFVSKPLETSRTPEPPERGETKP